MTYFYLWPQVKVWEADQDFTTANDTFVYIGSPLETYITDLAPGKSYMLRVLAFSRGGDGKKSSPPWRFQMGMCRFLAIWANA